MNNSKYFFNPVLPGSYPDPSICRVKENYYLVTSSFNYFPGIPIFKSKNLVEWKQIGHVLDRTCQLELDGLSNSQGIYAPTIRHHKGIYYITCTNVGGNGNFVVTTKNPEESWSEIFWIDSAKGIDPSLFFDDDDKAYFIGTRNAKDSQYFGDNEIWVQEFDYKKMKLMGESKAIWRGAAKNAIWTEGPHIYKINNFYYLLSSEGGTEYYHSLVITRSKNIYGPYEFYRGNPILTHRHLGKTYPISNVGHGDIVKTQNDEWWIVLLASRPYGGEYENLGRETFLVPMIWEDGWPIVSPGTGKVESTYKRPNLPECKNNSYLIDEDFDTNKLSYKWNFLQTPEKNKFDLFVRKGYLRLKLNQEKINELKNPSFVGVRQKHKNFTAKTIMEFLPENESECAGMVLIQSHKYHFIFEVTQKNGKNVIQLLKCNSGIYEVVARDVLSDKRVTLEISVTGQEYNFYFVDKNSKKTLAVNVDGRILSTNIAGGFVGTYIGLYACSKEKKSNNYADFDFFKYY